MRYELFYLIGAQKEADLERIKGEVNQMVLTEGGVIEEKATQERRKLAYEIKHQAFGFYVTIRFEMAPEKIAEISRKLNLYGDVLRFIVSRADELPELKTKEERLKAAGRIKEMAEVVNVVAPVEAPKTEEKPEVIEASSEAVTSESAKVVEEKATATEEDIDKKLDEILKMPLFLSSSLRALLSNSQQAKRWKNFLKKRENRVRRQAQDKRLLTISWLQK